MRDLVISNTQVGLVNDRMLLSLVAVSARSKTPKKVAVQHRLSSQEEEITSTTRLLC